MQGLAGVEGLGWAGLVEEVRERCRFWSLDGGGGGSCSEGLAAFKLGCGMIARDLLSWGLEDVPISQLWWTRLRIIQQHPRGKGPAACG